MLTVNGRSFVRQIIGGYFQDVSGHYWLFNAQKGWIKVDPSSKAFRQCLSIHTKASLLYRRNVANGKHMRVKRVPEFGTAPSLSIFDAERYIKAGIL